MHKPESVLENETHKLFRDFEIQMDQQISARLPDPIIINNNNNHKNRELAELCTLQTRENQTVKVKESKKKDLLLDLAKELKKTVEQESDGYSDCNWSSWYHIYPTPPLGQDMTKGQFLSGVQQV